MMDPLSITAGIIASLGALSCTAKAAKEFWDAPEELQLLCSELEQISILANYLGAITRERNFDFIDQRVCERAFARLQLTQTAFTKQFSRVQGGAGSHSAWFLRKTWVLHRSRIRKLAKDLSIVRQDFVKFMLLANL